MNSFPSRWSVSCCTARLKQLVGFVFDQVALQIISPDPDLSWPYEPWHKAPAGSGIPLHPPPKSAA